MAGRGIGHQVMIEEGHVLPETMVVASDSHSNMYGGLGCLGTPIVRTDAASIWATGRTWWQVPPTARVVLNGSLPPGATSKDVIIMLCGTFASDEVLNHAIEFAGPGVASLTVADRLTIANMSTEWGALAGLFPCDATTLEWLSHRANKLASRAQHAPTPSDASAADEAAASGTSFVHPRLSKTVVDELERRAATGEQLRPCADAQYALELSFDLSAVSPHVSGPNHVKATTPLVELEPQRVPVHKAYIVSCVNSRAADLAAAAAVLRERSVAEGVELYVAAASSEVQADATAAGDWQALIDAGARTLPPGCGPCVGLGAGLLKPGEVGISATNRNFRGRMGSRDAAAYLASPAVVAASAAAGYICGPATLPSLLHAAEATLAASAAAAHTSSEEATNHLPSAASVPANATAAAATTQRTPRTPAPQPQPGLHLSRARMQTAPGFSARVSGPIVLCPSHDINTDGIFAGTHTCTRTHHPPPSSPLEASPHTSRP
jgi:homoaconitate hydratase